MTYCQQHLQVIINLCFSRRSYAIEFRYLLASIMLVSQLILILKQFFCYVGPVRSFIHGKLVLLPLDYFCSETQNRREL